LQIDRGREAGTARVEATLGIEPVIVAAVVNDRPVLGSTRVALFFLGRSDRFQDSDDRYEDEGVDGEGTPVSPFRLRSSGRSPGSRVFLERRLPGSPQWLVPSSSPITVAGAASVSHRLPSSADTVAVKTTAYATADRGLLVCVLDFD
jgi:hypothetical protein